MNRKKTFVLCLAIAGLGAVTVSKTFNELSPEEKTLKENVEALSRDEIAVGNTGPGKIVKCVSDAGHKKFCMCENKNPCTESECE